MMTMAEQQQVAYQRGIIAVAATTPSRSQPCLNDYHCRSCQTTKSQRKLRNGKISSVKSLIWWSVTPNSTVTFLRFPKIISELTHLFFWYVQATERTYAVFGTCLLKSGNLLMLNADILPAYTVFQKNLTRCYFYNYLHEILTDFQNSFTGTLSRQLTIGLK